MICIIFDATSERLLDYNFLNVWTAQAIAAEQIVDSSDASMQLASAPLLGQDVSETASSVDCRPLYVGSGWVGNAWRQVKAYRYANHFRLKIADIGVFAVVADGSRIEVCELSPTLNKVVLTEALLGPPLMLALALRGTWTFHASAAMIDGKLIAFVGESGNGKSTLARFLDSQPGWHRVADDILPVVQTMTGVDSLPHFPQLKIAPDQQPYMGLPERIPLHAIYVISKPDERTEAVATTSLSAGQAMAEVIHHTVASRLFDSKLLAGQLDFAQHTAATLPVRRLEYPRRIEELPMIAEKLAAEIA